MTVQKYEYAVSLQILLKPCQTWIKAHILFLMKWEVKRGFKPGSSDF